MSEHTDIESDVLTDHTEVICSTSIERIVNGGNAALVKIEALIHQLDGISTLTSIIGGGIHRSGECDQVIAMTTGLRRRRKAP